MSIDLEYYAKNIEAWYQNDDFYELRTRHDFCKILSLAKLSGEQFNIILKKLKNFFMEEDIMTMIKVIKVNLGTDISDVLLILDAFAAFLQLPLFTDMKKLIQCDYEMNLLHQCRKTEEDFFKIYKILEYAAQEGDENTLKQSIEEGYCRVKNSFGDNIIISAADNGNLALVQALKHNGAKIRGTNNFNNTVLHKFCENGNLEGVKYALKYIDVNSKTTEDWTPLHFATANDHADICELLLQQKDIEKNHENNRKETPLALAISRNNKKAIEVLKRDQNNATTMSSPRKPIWVMRKRILRPGDE